MQCSVSEQRGPGLRAGKSLTPVDGEGEEVLGPDDVARVEPQHVGSRIHDERQQAEQRLEHALALFPRRLVDVGVRPGNVKDEAARAKDEEALIQRQVLDAQLVDQREVVQR